MSDQLKLCIKCKHYGKSYGYETCGAIRSPIDGGPGTYCLVDRQCGGRCGPSGRNWEPIPAFKFPTFKWFWQK